MSEIMDEIAREARLEGFLEGRAEIIIELGKEFGLTEEQILTKLQDKLSITKEKAKEYMEMFSRKAMFDAIHHIAIIGSDYEKSKHFYVNLLGFQVVREHYRAERDDYKIDLACGQQEIELFIMKNAPNRVNYPEALGLRHLAFKVKSVEDTVKELNRKGIKTEPVRLDDYTGEKMTFFYDPDGLPLEIHE